MRSLRRLFERDIDRVLAFSVERAEIDQERIRAGGKIRNLLRGNRHRRDRAGRKPTVIRLNAAEFSALSDAPVSTEALKHIAEKTTSVIGLTGAADIVSDGTQYLDISNGHPLMNSVTAMGCAASALVAACLCVEKDAFVATASALLAFGVAGEAAAETSKGPGSFAVQFIDALHSLDRATLIKRAKVT